MQPMRIQKYLLNRDATHCERPDGAIEFDVKMPPGIILSCGADQDDIAVWAMVAHNSTPITRRLLVVPTDGGFDPELQSAMTFIQTVQMLREELTWHVFELERAPQVTN